MCCIRTTQCNKSKRRRRGRKGYLRPLILFPNRSNVNAQHTKMLKPVPEFLFLNSNRSQTANKIDISK